MGWGGVEEADVDGDGLTDVSLFLVGKIAVFRSLGAAGLLAPKTAALNGSGGFNSATMFRVGDLNLDGKPDAVAVIGVAGFTSLSVVLDLGSPSAPQGIPVGNGITDLLLGDWNRDSALDLAVALGAPANGIGIYAGTGTGSFSPPSFVAIGSQPSAIRAADVNGDGNLDLVVGHAQLTVLLGNGAGGFGLPVNTAVCAPGCPGVDAVLLGDLNQDGWIDAVVSHPNSATTTSSTAVWMGDGTGGFLSSAAASPMPTGKASVLQDVTADGIPDFTSVALTSSINTIWAWTGNGLGGFNPSATAYAPIPGSTSYGTDVAVGDVTGDGIPDAVLPSGAVFPGSGFGTFQPPLAHAVPWGQSVALADVNRDLQTDLVLLQPTKNRITTYRNVTATAGSGFAYGLGCAGSHGFVPVLSAFGLPSPAGTVTLRIDSAAGGSPSAALFVSPSPTIIPVGFGCSLFVDPAALSFVPITITGPPVAGAGHASLAVGLPPVLPVPLAAAAQAVVFDPASPFSYSASNGMYFVIQ
jgi:hypothetical protein